eukprot:85479_1
MMDDAPSYPWVLNRDGKSRRKIIDYNYGGRCRAELHAWEFIQCMQKHEGTKRMSFAEVLDITEHDRGLWTLRVKEYKTDMADYFRDTTIERIKAKYSVRKRLEMLVFCCKALAALHNIGIAHKDILPRNIIITKGKLLLIDFNTAQMDIPDENLDTTFQVAKSKDVIYFMRLVYRFMALDINGDGASTAVGAPAADKWVSAAKNWKNRCERRLQPIADLVLNVLGGKKITDADKLAKRLEELWANEVATIELIQNGE